MTIADQKFGSLLTEHNSRGIPGPVTRFASGLVKGCAVVSLVIPFFSGVPLMAAEPPGGGSVSRHIRDAILSDFRGNYEMPSASVAAVPTDVEPEVVLLPAFKVADKQVSVKLSPVDVIVKTRTTPFILGSGIRENRGKKITMLTQTLFFVPIGWKIEW